jgi:hypothetical protein
MQNGGIQWECFINCPTSFQKPEIAVAGSLKNLCMLKGFFRSMMNNLKELTVKSFKPVSLSAQILTMNALELKMRLNEIEDFGGFTL